MRRWFAISGLCHAAVLVALALHFPAVTSAPRAPSTMFVSNDISDSIQEELLPEPEEPDEPRNERPPVSWELAETPDDECDDEEFDSIPSPLTIEPRTQVPHVRLKRPLHNPRQRNVQPAQTARAPASEPGPRGETREPALAGQPPTIPYPRRALRRGLEGSTELRILVTREGLVERVEITQSSGHAILDDAATAAVTTWRFSPALRDGVPVAAWTLRAIRFRLTAKREGIPFQVRLLREPPNSHGAAEEWARSLRAHLRATELQQSNVERSDCVGAVRKSGE